MPHRRPRQLLPLLEKRLRLFPVVGILGARQTGKSTLLRDLLPDLRTTTYSTLDRDENRTLAVRSPTLFIHGLETQKAKTICIDEVQKAPVLFDTIKAEVDERKRPGRFAISGSTEFSKKTGIHESLTGRISLLRVFPLNTSEILNQTPRFSLTKMEQASARKSLLSEIKSWAERGGMPGIFAIRDEENRTALFDSWIETTCTRDLAQFEIGKFKPDLAKRILYAVATLEVPNLTEIAREVGMQPRQIVKYLESFKALFVIYEIEPYKTSTGKPLYYLFDAGIARFAGSDFKRRLQIWFLNECFSQHSHAGATRPDIFYYQTTKGSRIDFLIQSKKGTQAVQLSQEESPSTYSLRVVESFALKHLKIPVFVLTPGLQTHSYKAGIKFIPWSAVGY